MQKTWSTKPGGILLDQKRKQIGSLSFLYNENEEHLAYQASFAPRMKN